MGPGSVTKVIEHDLSTIVAWICEKGVKVSFPARLVIPLPNQTWIPSAEWVAAWSSCGCKDGVNLASSAPARVLSTT
jgi:hypothetical protein